MRPVDAMKARRVSLETMDSAPVVALHGSAGSPRQWQALKLSMNGRRQVISPDVPGYGETPRAVVPIATMMDAEAAIILQQIMEIGHPVHLVGHSYGGAIALKMAMRAPSMFASLTVIEPAMFHLLNQGSAKDRKLYRQITSVAGMVSAAIADGSPGAGMERFVDFWNGRGSYAGYSPYMQCKLAQQVGQVAANFATGMAQDWNLDACRKISCPTMAIMGLESRTVAQRVTEMVAHSIPDMQMAMIAEAGHMVPFTHSGIVNRLIAGHIASAEASANDQTMLRAA